MERTQMTALIVQSRLDSTRLPQKALLPLEGEPLLYRVLQALSGVPCDRYILACPHDSLDAFSPIALRTGFAIFPGSKRNVLHRYCEAVRRFGIDRYPDARVIRATADNPFVFADAARAINAEGAALGADYAAYAGLPHGAGVESVAAKALLRAEREAKSPVDHEHVCPYIYASGRDFLVHRPLVPPIWQAPALNLSVDTAKDYERAQALYARLSARAKDGSRHRGAAIIKCAHEEGAPS
jgi:spore coat polysaccharide biosynthesis protein SpsF